MTRARDLANILQNAAAPQTGLVGLGNAQLVTNKTFVDYTESSYTVVALGKVNSTLCASYVGSYE